MTEPATRAEEEAAWARWCSTLPPAVRPVAERFPPWKRYRRKSTRNPVVVWAFDEGPDGKITLKVEVIRTDLRVKVFGVDPDDVEEIR